MLEARHLVKHCAEVCAVNDVSFSARPLAV